MPFWSSVSLVNVKKQQDWKKLFFLPSTDSCEGQTSAHSVHSERVSKRAEGSSTANTPESGWFPCAERSADPDRQNRGTNQFTFPSQLNRKLCSQLGCVCPQINFHKECGDDNMCSSNLQLKATFTDENHIPFPRWVWKLLNMDRRKRVHKQMNV